MPGNSATAASEPSNPPVEQKDWPDDSEAILELGEPRQVENYWTLKNAFEGTQIFGSVGSGKTSGSGRALARAFLESNLGGLILTAKTDETTAWKKLAAETGRSDDLIIFGAGEKWRFDFMSYERKRSGRGAAETENLVNLFCTVLESADQQNSGGTDAGYWQRAMRQLLRNAIDLASLALDNVTLTVLYRIVSSSANSLDQVADETWQKTSACFGLVGLAEKRALESGRMDDFELTRDFWLKDFPNLVPETRTAILSMFTSMADCFLRGLLRELFCTGLNFGPEDCFEGRIIIIDLPIKEYHKVGQFAQWLFKYIWQRAVERRIPADMPRHELQEKIRPVFLWADEAQFFVNQTYDALFQSTARSSRACTVYLTQTLPGYYTALGGASSGGAEALLGSLQTRIFHANGCIKTNTWASDVIGRTRQIQLSGNSSEADNPRRGGGQSAGGTMAFEYLVQPREFTVLRTGGVENAGTVEAIIFQGGRLWLHEKNGQQSAQNYIRQSFRQEPEK